MKQLLILRDGYVMGALWIRGRFEIGQDGVIVGAADENSPETAQLSLCDATGPWSFRVYS